MPLLAMSGAGCSTADTAITSNQVAYATFHSTETARASGRARSTKRSTLAQTSADITTTEPNDVSTARALAHISTRTDSVTDIRTLIFHCRRVPISEDITFGDSMNVFTTAILTNSTAATGKITNATHSFHRRITRGRVLLFVVITQVMLKAATIIRFPVVMG